MRHTNHSVGHEAEKYAAKYLKVIGFDILDINWKVRVCEIDIIAEKKETVYFVEVKYRATENQGSGTEYITPKKLQQMQYAAEVWVQEKKWTGDYQLAAIEVSGKKFEITNFVENIF